ncbi:MAG: hypothetical protein ACE5R4_19210 [Armatimonadota bacterium]
MSPSTRRIIAASAVAAFAFLLLAWLVAGRDRLGPALHRAAETGEWGTLSVYAYPDGDGAAVLLTGNGVVRGRRLSDVTDPRKQHYAAADRAEVRRLLSLLDRARFSKMDEEYGEYSENPRSLFLSVRLDGHTHTLLYYGEEADALAMPPELREAMALLHELWLRAMRAPAPERLPPSGPQGSSQ